MIGTGEAIRGGDFVAARDDHSGASEHRSGLRERKKERTRADLVAAGLRLFHRDGFEQTTTERIARETRVSQRTLFRYFATKSDIVLAGHREWQQDFLGCLVERPRGESHWVALVNASLQLLGEWGERQIGEQMRIRELLDDNPALQAAFLQNDRYFQDGLVELLLARPGREPEVGERERVRLVVATFSSVDEVASQLWLEHADPTPRRRLELQRRCTGELPAALVALPDQGRAN